MNDGSSIEEPGTDEIFAAVEQGLSVLDAAQLAAVSAMTGISIEKLIELGGIDDGEHPAVRTVREYETGKQDVP